jgi:hypothetical protein
MRVRRSPSGIEAVGLGLQFTQAGGQALISRCDSRRDAAELGLLAAPLHAHPGRADEARAPACEEAAAQQRADHQHRSARAERAERINESSQGLPAEFVYDKWMSHLSQVWS